MQPQSTECPIRKFREQLSIILELPFPSDHMTLSVMTPPSSKLYTELQHILNATDRLADMALPDGNFFSLSI